MKVEGSNPSARAMTNYNLSNHAEDSSDLAKKSKAKRKKVLDRVSAQRAELIKKFKIRPLILGKATRTLA